MSVKVPQGLMRHQKHHNCQCRFCLTHREAEAKVWETSQRIRMSQHAKHRQGTACDTISPADAASYVEQHGNYTSFDPDYPEPVNQTKLNALQQRSLGGAARTTTDVTGSETGTVTARSVKQTCEDLDELEKLLIEEHKARVDAAMKADKLSTMRNTGKAPGPAEVPNARNPLSTHTRHSYTRTSSHKCTVPGQDTAVTTFHATTDNGSSRSFTATNTDSASSCCSRATIHDAFELAHKCPVTPLSQCAASRELQDTLNSLRMIVMDPRNKGNEEALRQVIEGERVMPPTVRMNSTNALQTAKGSGSAEHRFGDSAAAVRTNVAHPRGAGVVWPDIQNIV